MNPAAPRRIAVALSGGLDSAFAAYLLTKKEEQEVIGLTLLLHQKDHGDAGMTFSRCCAPSDLAAARTTAHQLGIKHYVIDAQAAFTADVIEYFRREYDSLRTPNPCAVCNEKIKFGLLLDKARALQCSALATGHYARVDERDGRYCLRNGIDRDKDQSYFLFGLSQQQLRFVHWPLGEWCKTDVRVAAGRAGLNVPERESQEVCFIPDDLPYAEWLRQRGLKPRPGPIVDVAGKKLGTHNGLHQFTIGQRRGIGIGGGPPLYVIALRGDDNALVVGPAEANRQRAMTVAGLNLVALKSWPKDFTAQVKYRYQTPAAAATVSCLGKDRLAVCFAEPQPGLTPGQAAVFYQDDLVLGGGWIEEVMGNE